MKQQVSPMQTINLSGAWRYFAPPASDTQLYNARQLNDKTWAQMDLPQHWAAAKLQHQGQVWYRRTFEMSPNEACSAWWLEFEGVDYHCAVWVNEQFIGAHEGYFGKFRFDVTTAVALGENQITFCVTSRDPKPDLPHKQKQFKGVLTQDYVPWRRLLSGVNVPNTGGVWGDVALRAYPCEDAPQAEDWYQPLAEPAMKIDPQTLVWTDAAKPFFPRGTNYFPSFLIGSMTRQDFAADIRLMLAANINIVRVYAHVLPDVFYQLCDEMGLLVWQDFPFYDGFLDTPEIEASALNQAEEMVRGLGHHACIVAWGVQTEAPWLEKGHDQNRALAEKIAAKIRSLDPKRYVHLGNRLPTAFRIFSRLRDYLQTLPDQPLPLAFGAPAVPTQASLEARLNDQQRDLKSLLLAEGLPLEDGESAAEFIQNSQEYQANFIKYTIERYRALGRPSVTGVFQHMFVDALPSISSAVIDHTRGQRQGYKALESALRPILPIALFESNSMPIMPAGADIPFALKIINDTEKVLEAWSCKVSVTGWQSREQTGDATYMHHWSNNIDEIVVGAYGVSDVGDFVIPALPARPQYYHMVLQLFDIRDESLASLVNVYVLRVV